MENQSAPRRANEVGPVGRRAAQNLERLRDSRRLSQGDLASAVERLGRPMTRQIVSKAEAGERRIDVDDLVAFAVALDTSTNRLLLPGTADAADPVDLAPRAAASALQAWRWARGIEPLYEIPAPDEPLLFRSDREAQFVRENQPDNLPRYHDANRDIEDHPDVARMAATVLLEARHRGLRYADLARLIEQLDRYRQLGQLENVIAKLAELGNGHASGKD